MGVLPSINSFCGLQNSFCQRLANVSTFLPLRLNPKCNKPPESVATRNLSKSRWGTEELSKLSPGVYKDGTGAGHIRTHMAGQLRASDKTPWQVHSHTWASPRPNPVSELGCKTPLGPYWVLSNLLRIISVQKERERRFWHEASFISSSHCLSREPVQS